MRVELEIWRELVQQKRVREATERQRAEDHASLVRELRERLQEKESRLKELEALSLSYPSPEQQQEHREEEEKEEHLDKSAACEKSEDTHISLSETSKEKQRRQEVTPHSSRAHCSRKPQRPPKLLLLSLSLSLSDSFTGRPTIPLAVDKKEPPGFRMLDLRDSFPRPYLITVLLQASVLFAKYYGLHRAILPYHPSLRRILPTGIQEDTEIPRLRHFIKHVLHKDKLLNLRDFMNLLHLYARDNGMAKVLWRVAMGDFSGQTALA